MLLVPPSFDTHPRKPELDPDSYGLRQREATCSRAEFQREVQELHHGCRFDRRTPYVYLVAMLFLGVSELGFNAIVFSDLIDTAPMLALSVAFLITLAACGISHSLGHFARDWRCPVRNAIKVCIVAIAVVLLVTLFADLASLRMNFVDLQNLLTKAVAAGERFETVVVPEIPAATAWRMFLLVNLACLAAGTAFSLIRYGAPAALESATKNAAQARRQYETTRRQHERERKRLDAEVRERACLDRAEHIVRQRWRSSRREGLHADA